MKDMTVFIVDDDRFCSNMYKQHLMKMGFVNIQTFNSGEECLCSIAAQPDLMIVDYDMAALNGLQVMQIVKRLYPQIDILMISGRKEPKIATDAMRYGAAAYIKKDGKELEMLSAAANNIVARQRYNMNRYTA